MLIGYARCSTEDQRLDLQKDALAKAGVDGNHVYEEYVSGVKTRRPELQACLRALREGDTLVVWRLDRLGRSLRELIEILDRLARAGIGFRSLNESIDTTNAVGRMIFHVLAAIAQFERDLVSERTIAGLKAARARGHRGGRPPKLKAKDVRLAQTMLDASTFTMDEIAERLGCAKATVYRALARERETADAKALGRTLKHTAA